MEVPVRVGDILAGKYRVERILGAGNMGVVVAARHVSLGQLVALKFMLPGKGSRPEQRERFLREAQAAVRLRSQHVGRVLDVGTLENGSPYIVMEFLEGQDLDARLKARGPLPISKAVEYMLQACEAVGEAHAAGIVHRDLKPANLFLTTEVGGSPCIKVLDFGISKLSNVDLSLTNESQSMGSPLYMSPEQMGSSKHVDARSDIWSLGVVLYQLIAGWTPFHSETIAELCGRVLYGAPTPLHHYRSDAPTELWAAILRCLERDREKRFRNVAEFAAAIAPFAAPRARVHAERAARVLGVGGADLGAATEELPLGVVAPAVTGPRAVVEPASNLSSPAARAASFPPFRPPAAAADQGTDLLPRRPSDAPLVGASPTAVGAQSSGPPVAGLQRGTATDSAWGGTGAGSRGPQGTGKRAVFAASILGVVAAAVAATVWFVRSPGPAIEAAPSADAPASARPASAPPPAPLAPAAASAEPFVSPSAQVTASASASAATPPVVGTTRKQAPLPKPTAPAQPVFEGVY